ncbi:MAG: hypothetical protein WEB60_04515 [Terrimicrobiaceae bacterium]
MPVLRWLFDTEDRRKFNNHIRSAWNSLKSYPGHSRHVPWKAIIIFVVIPTFVFYNIKSSLHGSGDSQPVLMIAASLLNEGNLELSEYLTTEGEIPYYLTETSTGIYSSYPAGMLGFALPLATASKIVGAKIEMPRVRNRIEKLTASIVVAASLGLFLLIALHIVPVKAAGLTTLFLGVGSAMFSTVGQGLWQHGGVILGSLLVLLIEFRSQRQPRPADLWIQGFTCAFMMACRLSSVLFLAPFLLWVFVRSPRRAIGIFLVAIISFFPWGALYGSIYPSIFGPSTGQITARLWNSPATEAVAVLLSPGRGFFIYQPWALLAFMPLIPIVRRQWAESTNYPVPRGWVIFCAVVIFAHIFLVSSWGMWWGGHCWGSRLLSEAVPFVALLCLPGIAFCLRLPLSRFALIFLLVVSALLHLPHIMFNANVWNGRADVDSHPERLWSWSDAPFLIPLRPKQPMAWETQSHQ